MNKNQLLQKLFILMPITLLVAWLIFSYFEADTEINILCSNIYNKQDKTDVINILNTGEYIQISNNKGSSDTNITIESLYNFYLTSCHIVLTNGKVASATYKNKLAMR